MGCQKKNILFASTEQSKLGLVNFPIHLTEYPCLPLEYKYAHKSNANMTFGRKSIIKQAMNKN